MNIFFISKISFYDSLINLGILNYIFFFCKKILIGKKFNQFSLLKKTNYLSYFISFKKFLVLLRLKNGNINYFSRINNEIIFVKSFKIFFFVLTGSTISFYSLNLLNFFLTQRFNFSNIIFVTYINNINVFKIFNCFLNKTIIYYMINNNFIYLFDYLNYLNLYYLFFSESASFYTEHSLFFNIYDLILETLLNFLNIRSPKYIIINNFFNFINLINFIIFFN